MQPHGYWSLPAVVAVADRAIGWMEMGLAVPSLLAGWPQVGVFQCGRGGRQPSTARNPSCAARRAKPISVDVGFLMSGLVVIALGLGRAEIQPKRWREPIAGVIDL